VKFTKQVNIIESKYQAMIGPYLTNKAIPTIKKYVYNARMSDLRIPLQWKNNSCESINHILKLNQDWKVHSHFISHVPRHVFTQVPGTECKLRIRKA
jgi:hypothetical protein